MITPRMYQVKYDASLRTVLSNFRFTLWGPAPHHSLKSRIFFWLPARWASGFSGDHQQDHQCLCLLLCYSFVLSFIDCILLGIKLLLLLLLPQLMLSNARFHFNGSNVECTLDLLWLPNWETHQSDIFHSRHEFFIHFYTFQIILNSFCKGNGYETPAGMTYICDIYITLGAIYVTSACDICEIYGEIHAWYMAPKLYIYMCMCVLEKTTLTEDND